MIVLLVSGCYQRVFSSSSTTNVAVKTLMLEAGVTYTFRTADLEGPAPDTVMHLFDGSSAWVASNDECPGAPLGDHGSCITHTPTRRDKFSVLVHAFDDANWSRGSLVVDRAGGTGWLFEKQEFGGASFKDPGDAVGWSRNDMAVSVSALHGPSRTVCLALAVAPGDRNDIDGGTRPASFIRPARSCGTCGTRTTAGRQG